jgi:hypothetical protein
MRTGLIGTTFVVQSATGPPSPPPDDELPPPDEDAVPTGGPPLLDELELLGPPPLLDELLPLVPLLVPGDPLDELPVVVDDPLLDELLPFGNPVFPGEELEHAAIAAAPTQPTMAHAATPLTLDAPSAKPMRRSRQSQSKNVEVTPRVASALAPAIARGSKSRSS